MTYYDILGISRTAIDSEIKKAYHQMIIAFHPDNYQGDKQFSAKKTHEIIEAYKVLRNPATRKHYDDLLNSQGRNTTEKINKNTSASATGYPSRKNKDTSFHSQNANPRGVNKCKVMLIVIGILFVVFVVALFAMIIINI